MPSHKPTFGSGFDAPLSEAVAAYNRVLRALDVEQEFSSFARLNFPEPWGTLVGSRWLPRFLVEVEHGPMLEPAVAESLREELSRLLDNEKVGVGAFRDCTFQDFLGVGLLLAALFRTMPVPPSGTAAQTSLRLRGTGELAWSPDRLAPVVEALFKAVDLRLLKYNRLDTRILHGTFRSNDTPGAFPRQQLVIVCGMPQKESVTFNGEMRPVYRCGQCWGPMGIKWVRWDGARLGLEAGRSYDVFVQSHAFDQLLKRLKCFDPRDGMLYEYLWRSLLEPTIVERPNGQRLVEYRLAGHRFGYFPIGIAEGPARIVLKTFLFLTMDGTPESDKLWQILKLRRDDKEYWNLACFIHQP